MTVPITIYGFEKSGTSLAWAICKTAQRANDCYSTYAMQSGLAQLVRDACGQYTNVCRMADVDQLLFDGSAGGWQLEVPHPAVRQVPVSIRELRARSSLIHTHCPPSLAAESDRTCIYTVRDPRDSLVSWARYATRPQMLWRYDNPTTDWRILLANEETIRVKAQAWTKHVERALRRPDLIWWPFERMRDCAADCFNDLRDCAGLAMDPAAGAEAVSFESMHSEWPEHVQRGESGAWESDLPAPAVGIVETECRETMGKAGLEW